MSYVALVTDQYEEMARFYGERLGLSVVDQWDRENARGVRFDIGGMRLELLDNQREDRPLELGQVADRFHVVIEVDDVDTAWQSLNMEAPEPATVSWGARLFRLQDPDGVSVTYLQWLQADSGGYTFIRGKVSSGAGKGQHFTRLDWARAQFVDKLGIDPYPGTLNLIVEDQGSQAAWSALRDGPGIRIENLKSGSGDCQARCYRVQVAGCPDAAIVLPEVGAYPENEVEIIAPIALRNALGIKDGDEIVLQVSQSEQQPAAGGAVE
jgi:catechol 2,3-dioxygenase-like lactoylglutathione lyase family enzyme